MTKRSIRNPLASRRRDRQRSRAARQRNRVSRLQRFEQLESRRLLATYVVDTTADLAMGTCDGSSGSCSIRVALDLAASSVDPINRIEVPAGNYLIDDTLGTLNYTSANDLVFAGTGATPEDVVIDGQLQHRLLDLVSTGSVAAPPTVTLEQLTLQNGGAGGTNGRGMFGGPEGGGVNSTDFNLVLDLIVMQGNVIRGLGAAESAGLFARGTGTVSISNSVFRDNPVRPATAVVDVGMASRLEITSSTFHNNSAGVDSTATIVDIEDSVFSENVFYGFQSSNAASPPTVVIQRSSFFDNKSLEGSPGTISVTGGDLLLENVTASNNEDPAVSVGRDFYGGPVSGIIRNSTLSGSNFSVLHNISGAISFESSIIDGDCFIGTSFGAPGPGVNTSLGNNLDANGTCGLVEPSDLVNVDPLLLPLAFNGGPVPTLALEETSPAIDAASSSSPATDARGVPRPQDGNADGSAEPDIGAFEFVPEVQILSIADVVVDEADGTATVTITLDRDAPDAFDVDIFTLDGSPYTGNEQTLSFHGFAGEAVDYIITFQDDLIVEEDVSLTVAMGSASLDSVDTMATATLTIRDDDTATLTIEDITADESDGSREFSIRVDNPVDGGFTVSPALVGGTATLADDFSFDSAAITFSGVESETQTFSVSVVDDDLSEPAETVEFGFSATAFPGAAIVDTDTAVLTITNNDTAVLTLSDVTVDESDASAVVTVGLDIATQESFMVDVFTTDSLGTRTNVGTLDFVGDLGETQTLTITFSDDAVVEEDEMLTLSLGVPTQPDINSASIASLQIIDDDIATLSVVDVIVDEAAGTATLTVEVDNAVDGGFTVTPTVSGGSANIDDDYLFDGSTLLTFAGQVDEQQSFTVSIVDDIIDEVDEDAVFAFDATPMALDTGGSSGETANSGRDIDDAATLTMTITDNDPPPVLSITDRVVIESDETASIEITLDSPVPGGFTVEVANNAETGETLGSEILTFAGTAGETQSYVVNFADDDIVEDDEVRAVEFVTSSASNLDISANGTLTIQDDDTAVLSVANVIVDEAAGTATLTVEVDNAVDGGFTVQPSIFGGDATIDVDYEFDFHTILTFAGDPGEQQSFTVTILPDEIDEPDETVEFSFVATPRGLPGSPPVTGRDIDDADTAVLTIIDDDAPAGFAVLEVESMTVNESAQTADVVVRLINDFQDAFTINAVASDQSGAVTSQSTLSFAGGIATQTLTVSFGDDDIVEPDEQIFVELSNPSIANVDFSSTGTLTILDDDTATLSIEDVTANEDAGTQTFTVSVDREVDGGFEVDVSVVMATALNGFDYLFDSTTALSFHGEAAETQTFTVTIVDDTDDEPDETVAFGLSASTRGVTLDIDDVDTAILTIVDDDDPFVPTGATVQGHTYCDLNANDIEEAGEAAVGALIFLDQNGNRVLDPGEQSVLTDSVGDFLFTDVPPGEAVVAAVAPASCNTIPRNPGVTRSVIDVGDLARAITATDADGDGDQDLLVVTDLDNGLAVLQNNDGAFSLERTMTLASRPYDIEAWHSPGGASGSTPAIGVATIGGSGQNGLLLSGSLTGLDSTPSGSGPIDVAIGDFNGDNSADFVTASFRSSDLHLHLSGSTTSQVVATGRLVRGVTVADVNGDSHEDIVLVNAGYADDSDAQVGLLIGNGSGEFAAPLLTRTLKDFVEVRVAEIGNGGQPEILALTSTGQVLLFDELLNQVGSVNVDQGASAFDVGDFNRDGNLDIAVANLGDELIQLMTGNGQGEFVEITRVQNVDAPSDLVVTDVNNDGFAEIAVTNFQRKITQDDGSIVYRIPSSVTILQLGVEEAPLVVAEESVNTVDFAFPSADPTLRLDTTGDGVVTMQDLLSVLNTMSHDRMLSRRGLSGETAANKSRPSDVNGDGETTPRDALIIINYLAEQHYVTRISNVAQSEWLDDRDDEDEPLTASVDLALDDLVGATF